MIAMIEILTLPFLACLLMTLILGYLGSHVLKREVIFIDISLAQIAALGALTAHIVFKAHSNSILGYGCAVCATLMAAAFFAFSRNRIVEIPLEAIIGVIYAIAAGATLFIIGVAAGGHVHVHDLLAGSILWVTKSDIAICAVCFALVGVCFYCFRKPFGEISENYEAAHKEGRHVLCWDFLFYALFGVVITFCVRIAGVVVVFAFLIMPATISALVSRRESVRLFIAWGSGILTSVSGLVFSYRYDFSVGPSVALFLGILLFLVAVANKCASLSEAKCFRKSRLGKKCNEYNASS